MSRNKGQQTLSFASTPSKQQQPQSSDFSDISNDESGNLNVKFVMNEMQKLSIDQYNVNNLDNIIQYNSDFFVMFWAEQLVSWLMTKGTLNCQYIVTIPHTDAKTKKNAKEGEVIMKTAVSLISIKTILKKVFENYEGYIKTNLKGDNDFELNKNAIQYFIIEKIKEMEVTVEPKAYPESSKSPSKNPSTKYKNMSSLNQMVREKLKDEYTDEEIQKIVKSLDKRLITVKQQKEKKDNKDDNK
jgi:hypothetical protein